MQNGAILITNYEYRELFQQAKSSLDIKNVAQDYGLHINRAGKALCPFHADSHPSLSFKGQFFKCFACNEGGDIFKLVGHLTKLKLFETLKELNSRYALNLNLDNKNQTAIERVKSYKKQREIALKQSQKQAFDKWVLNAFKTCTSYAKLLRTWQVYNAPKAENEPLNPLFIESMQQLSRVEYLCEILTLGDKQDFKNFYTSCRLEVKAIEQRVISHERERKQVS